MAHRGLTAVLVSGVLLVSSAAVAQEPKGRFSMSPVDGGFVRLDTETGAMSHCTRVDERWTCEAMGDASGDATKQLDRLKKENEELRAEIKRLDDMLGLGDGSRPGLPSAQPEPHAGG